MPHATKYGCHPSDSPGHRGFVRGRMCSLQQRFDVFRLSQRVRYYRCRACRTIQLAPLPGKEDLERAYAAEYARSKHIEPDADFYQGSSRHYFEAILSIVRRNVPAGRVSEIGAGWGVLAGMLMQAGYDYEGVELSEEMLRYSFGRGLPVIPGGIEAFDSGDRAAVVMTNVFEHLVDHDQRLDRLASLLPERGIFITAQPTARFVALFGTLFRLGIKRLPLPQLHVILTPPWHTVLFSIRGIETLLGRHGFELIEVRPAPQGREKGLNGLLQRILEAVNRLGWRLAGTKWPLVIGHVFVFRKNPRVRT